MKKLFLLGFCAISLIAKAQNTFPYPANGDVGIGTTTPTAELEVIGEVKATKGVFTNNVTGNSTLKLGEELPGGRRNIDFYVNSNATSSQLNLGSSWFDSNNKVRFYHYIYSNKSYTSYFAPNGSEYFKLDFGGLGTNKVYMHLPKPDSRIVIGSWGSYLPEHKFVVKNGSAMIEGNIFTNSNIGIGTNSFTDGSDTYRLSINGKVRAHAVKVYTDWADFVFEADYDLPTLNEVEAFIKENGHLKDIPSAKEVEEKGIELGEMNKLLLQKIEELTLYIIEKNHQINQLSIDVDELKKKAKN